MFSVLSLAWETLLGVNFHMGIRLLHRSDVVMAILFFKTFGFVLFVFADLTVGYKCFWLFLCLGRLS